MTRQARALKFAGLLADVDDPRCRLPSLVADGLSNPAVASALCLRPVRAHRARPGRVGKLPRRPESRALYALRCRISLVCVAPPPL
jgi:hypothetical protein